VTIREAVQALTSRRLSSVELTSAAIKRIDRLNGPLKAFITVTADMALNQARRADAELMAGRHRGPLHGLPVALKDLFLTRGVLTTCGSVIHRDFVPDEDATVVKRLHDAGAVMVGKLNMHELA
jgi:aspartyl-tRNA(Asn)/glutamyl-tRNA(Gln) amidotransferase subunit A